MSTDGTALAQIICPPFRGVRRLTAGIFSFLLASLLYAQEETKKKCAPDEVDLGEYCARLVNGVPVRPQRRPYTRFPSQTMMPGAVTRSSEERAKQRAVSQNQQAQVTTPAQVQPSPQPSVQAPVSNQTQPQVRAAAIQANPAPPPAQVNPGANEPLSGDYVIQVAALKSHATSINHMKSLRNVYGRAALGRLIGDNRNLWLIMVGPYADREQARSMLQRIKTQPAYQGAWMRTLENIEITDFDHD